MTVTFQGVGTWALSTTSGATITYAFPGGYTKTVGDLMLLVSGGWTGTTTAPSTRPSNTQGSFSLRGTSVRTPGGGSIIIFYEWKLVTSSTEGTVTRTVPTDGNWSSSNNTWNLGGYMLVFRGVDQSSPFDQTSDTTNNSAAASTWQGPSITAATATTMIVQSAISGDNNQLVLGSANGFTARASGSSYSSSVTGLEAFGSATQAYTTTGAKTGPTWSQSINGPDSWAAIATIIRGATIPGAPTSVAATITGSTTASVTWTAPVSTGNAAGGITSYTVEYSTNGTTWTSAGTSSASPKAVTGLTAGTAYYFRVSATNVIGTGATGSTSPTTYTTWTVPGAPTAITTTRATATATSIDVSWTAPASNGGTAITAYTVQYSVDGGSFWTTFSSAIATTSTTVTGLVPFDAYLFRVSATNSVGTGAYGTITYDSYTDTNMNTLWGTKWL